MPAVDPPGGGRRRGREHRRALVLAHHRGGHRVLPGPHADKRVCQLASEATYETLVSCGVRVWNFQPSMMHAKTMCVDGAAAVIGSSNFNRRSLDHDEEVVLVALDTEVAAELEGHFDEDLERSEQIDLTRWRNRGPIQRTLEVATTPLRRFL